MTRATLIVFSCLIASFLAGECKAQEQKATATPLAATTQQSPSTTKRADHGKTITPLIMELPTEALATWRGFSDKRPTLVLLSNNPFLQPIPDQISASALTLAKKGTTLELRRRGTSLTVAPLLFPDMTLTAALRAGFLARVIWVIPAKIGAPPLSEEIFRKQLLEIGAATTAEAFSFRLKGGALSGQIQSVPFLVTPEESLPALAETVLLHIDLSYFQPLYQGEIKTPLYPLLAGTLSRIRRADWPVAAVTISLSNLEGGIPLASRPVGADLAAFFRDPSLTESSLPEKWRERANALYLENFFLKERIREIYLKLESAAPADPSIKYALYALARQSNEGEKALNYLRQAVHLDPVYAREYLDLATLAEEKNLPDQSLRMLESARAAFPDNPFIPLRMTDTLLNHKEYKAATQLLARLAKESWSPIYYPRMPALLAELSTMATTGKVPAQRGY